MWSRTQTYSLHTAAGNKRHFHRMSGVCASWGGATRQLNDGHHSGAQQGRQRWRQVLKMPQGLARQHVGYQGHTSYLSASHAFWLHPNLLGQQPRSQQLSQRV